MIELQVNGVTYTDFVDASVTLALDTMANDFSFTASAVNGFPPFKDGDNVKCIVDGKQVLDGYIDTVNGSESEGSHLVTYEGRDKTLDFIDSDINVIPDIRANGNLTLKSIIQIVIKHLGQSIEVIDKRSPEAFNAAEDVLVPKVGQNALDFVRLYAMKRQALLSSDGNGNIVITESLATESGETLTSVQNDNNDIISQSWHVSGRERFNTYINRGQLDPIALNFTPSPDIAGVESQSGGVSDLEVRAGRQKVKVESKGYSNAQLVDRAKWSKQIAKARAFEFNCIVKGHSKKSGGVWDVNELVFINSLAADITQSMLINAVTFNESSGQATTTSLEFVEKDVYTINEKLLSQKKVGNQQTAYWKSA